MACLYREYIVMMTDLISALMISEGYIGHQSVTVTHSRDGCDAQTPSIQPVSGPAGAVPDSAAPRSAVAAPPPPGAVLADWRGTYSLTCLTLSDSRLSHYSLSQGAAGCGAPVHVTDESVMMSAYDLIAPAICILLRTS